MTTEELINKIELLKAEIEWELPISYQIYLQEVIDKIKNDRNN